MQKLLNKINFLIIGVFYTTAAYSYQVKTCEGLNELLQDPKADRYHKEGIYVDLTGESEKICHLERIAPSSVYRKTIYIHELKAHTLAFHKEDTEIGTIRNVHTIWVFEAYLDTLDIRFNPFAWKAWEESHTPFLKHFDTGKNFVIKGGQIKNLKLGDTGFHHIDVPGTLFAKYSDLIRISRRKDLYHGYFRSKVIADKTLYPFYVIEEDDDEYFEYDGIHFKNITFFKDFEMERFHLKRATFENLNSTVGKSWFEEDKMFTKNLKRKDILVLSYPQISEQLSTLKDLNLDGKKFVGEGNSGYKFNPDFVAGQAYDKSLERSVAGTTFSDADLDKADFTGLADLDLGYLVKMKSDTNNEVTFDDASVCTRDIKNASNGTTEYFEGFENLFWFKMVKCYEGDQNPEEVTQTLKDKMIEFLNAEHPEQINETALRKMLKKSSGKVYDLMFELARSSRHWRTAFAEYFPRKNVTPDDLQSNTKHILEKSYNIYVPEGRSPEQWWIDHGINTDEFNDTIERAWEESSKSFDVFLRLVKEEKIYKKIENEKKAYRWMLNELSRKSKSICKKTIEQSIYTVSVPEACVFDVENIATYRTQADAYRSIQSTMSSLDQIKKLLLALDSAGDYNSGVVSEHIRDEFLRSGAFSHSLTGSEDFDKEARKYILNRMIKNMRSHLGREIVDLSRSPSSIGNFKIVNLITRASETKDSVTHYLNRYQVLKDKQTSVGASKEARKEAHKAMIKGLKREVNQLTSQINNSLPNKKEMIEQSTKDKKRLIKTQLDTLEVQKIKLQTEQDRIKSLVITWCEGNDRDSHKNSPIVPLPENDGHFDFKPKQGLWVNKIGQDALLYKLMDLNSLYTKDMDACKNLEIDNFGYDLKNNGLETYPMNNWTFPSDLEVNKPDDYIDHNHGYNYKYYREYHAIDCYFNDFYSQKWTYRKGMCENPLKKLRGEEGRVKRDQYYSYYKRNISLTKEIEANEIKRTALLEDDKGLDDMKVLSLRDIKYTKDALKSKKEQLQAIINEPFNPLKHNQLPEGFSDRIDTFSTSATNEIDRLVADLYKLELYLVALEGLLSSSDSLGTEGLYAIKPMEVPQSFVDLKTKFYTEYHEKFKELNRRWSAFKSSILGRLNTGQYLTNFNFLLGINEPAEIKMTLNTNNRDQDDGDSTSITKTLEGSEAFASPLFIKNLAQCVSPVLNHLMGEVTKESHMPEELEKEIIVPSLVGNRAIFWRNMPSWFGYHIRSAYEKDLSYDHLQKVLKAWSLWKFARTMKIYSDAMNGLLVTDFNKNDNIYQDIPLELGLDAFVDAQRHFYIGIVPLMMKSSEVDRGSYSAGCGYRKLGSSLTCDTRWSKSVIKSIDSPELANLNRFEGLDGFKYGIGQAEATSGLFDDAASFLAGIRGRQITSGELTMTLVGPQKKAYSGRYFSYLLHSLELKKIENIDGIEWKQHGNLQVGVPLGREYDHRLSKILLKRDMRLFAKDGSLSNNPDMIRFVRKYANNNDLKQNCQLQTSN